MRNRARLPVTLTENVAPRARSTDSAAPAVAALTVSRIGESSAGSAPAPAALVALVRWAWDACDPAAAGSAPRIAFRSTFCIPTVQAR
jgi:hypothetical protein